MGDLLRPRLHWPEQRTKSRAFSFRFKLAGLWISQTSNPLCSTTSNDYSICFPKRKKLAFRTAIIPLSDASLPFQISRALPLFLLISPRFQFTCKGGSLRPACFRSSPCWDISRAEAVSRLIFSSTTRLNDLSHKLGESSSALRFRSRLAVGVAPEMLSRKRSSICLHGSLCGVIWDLAKPFIGCIKCMGSYLLWAEHCATRRSRQCLDEAWWYICFLAFSYVSLMQLRRSRDHRDKSLHLQVAVHR